MYLHGKICYMKSATNATSERYLFCTTSHGARFAWAIQSIEGDNGADFDRPFSSEEYDSVTSF
jgi:hypothetical protein